MTRSILAWLVLLAAAAVPAAAQSPGPAACTQATPLHATCTCDIRTLHPLQGALGADQVQGDVERIRANPDRAWRKLNEDPIAVVQGPEGLYITDHHHTAAAWLRYGRPLAPCTVAHTLPTDPAAFWPAARAQSLDHLEDKDGNPITPAQLPKTLAAMPDDPYRSLAGQIRYEGAFCRSRMQQPEFAEFTWADWLRHQPLPKDLTTRPAIDQATALARSPAAAAIPGYLGQAKCPDKN